MNGAGLTVFAGTPLPPLPLLADALRAAGLPAAQMQGADLKQQLSGLSTPPEALAIGLHDARGDAQALLQQGFALFDTIRLCRDVCGRLPRRAVGVFAQSAQPTAAAVSAVTGSLMRYATSHLLYEDIALNLIAYRDTPLGHRRAADAARALLSGMMDTVRGQTLILTDD